MTQEELLKLTPEQQCIQIADLQGFRARSSNMAGGWELVGPTGALITSKWCTAERSPKLSDFSDSLPDYLNDLNAMHEAEDTIPEHLRGNYEAWLIEQVKPGGFYHVPHTGQILQVVRTTATQRANAFLLTVG